MKYVSTVFILLVLAACQMGKFDRYPGSVQKAFPEHMRGTYYFVIPAKYKAASSGIKTGDTIMYLITENSITVIDTAGKRSQRMLDNDEVLTLVDGKYYVVSTRDRDYRQYWNCMVYEADKKGLSVYPLIDETRASLLKKYFNARFIGLSESKDSVFVYEMNEEKFTEYFKKELKSDAIFLKRLN